MLQSAPHAIKKIEKNIGDIKALLKDGDTIMDAGCGQGVLYTHLGKPEGYSGIDINAGEIREARIAWPDGPYKVMDLYDLKGSWDVVICSRVLIHLPDFEGAMKVLLGCAKRHCVIVVPTDGDKVSDEGTRYFRSFSVETLSSVGKCEIKHHSPYSTVIYEGA
jgi:2-polyprenyl-3-methyl-5-hydroxy-6-metoxy-1,4-benzoquinol methylase